MNKYLLVLLVLGMGVASISNADVEISNKTLITSRGISSDSYGSPQNTYSTEDGYYVSSNDEIKQTVEKLRIQSEQNKEKLELLKKPYVSDWQREQEKEQRELAKKPNARIGMTRNQILNKSNWGEPDDINTTIDAYGTFEQWIYESGQYLYFKNGKLTSIQY